MTTSFTFVQDTTPCIDRGLQKASGSTVYQAENGAAVKGSFLSFKMQNKTKQNIFQTTKHGTQSEGPTSPSPSGPVFVMSPWEKREVGSPRLRKFPQRATALLAA